MNCEEMGGWMTCDFTSFSTVFHSNQDNGPDDNERLCAVEPRLRLRRIRLEWGLDSGPLDQ